MIYVAGSLRNEGMRDLDTALIAEFPDQVFFMDWYSAGPEADDHWKGYYHDHLGLDYVTALKEPASLNVFNFDKKHIDLSDILILAAPAGKSAHLELGYSIGAGKIGIYYFPSMEDTRWDVMLNFAQEVCVGQEQLFAALRKHGC